MAVKCPKCDTNNPDTQQFCGECGTQVTPGDKSQPSFTKTLETPVSELTRGTLFADRYEIIEELGSGGMGKVYRVEDKKTKEEIAIKLIRPEVAADKKMIDRFRNELTTARKIRHKNICGMYDLSEHKGTHFITMEYVSGEDLKGLIRRVGRLDSGTAVKIANQVCEGLSEAHRLDVIHRDLKPSNVMIDREGNARIMDFGIARSVKAKGLTGEGIIIGTPEYMSPEQAEAKEVDHRSDIYSLGVILYEMVTGQLPFEGDTPLSIAMKHKGEIPKNPKELNPQIQEDFNSLILNCLEKDKEKRYQSTEEVRSELTNIEKGIPTTDRAIPRRKPLTSREITVQFSLKKLFPPAIVIVAIVIVGLILWQMLSKQKIAPLAPSGKPSLAVMYFENNTGDENLDHWRKGISDLLITDLTQSKYLNVLGGDRLFNILSQMDQLEAKSYSSEILKQVATRGGVNHIARGSYSKAGDILRIDIVLQDARSGEPIATERVEGKGEEGIFTMVDELTMWIKTGFNFSEEMIKDDLDSLIEKTTTSSPEAYKYFNEGFRYNWKGDYQRSVQLLERAVAIDPEFAIAYMVLGEAWGHLGYSTKRKQFHQKAFDLSDRVSERERYRIQGYYYRRSGEKSYDKSIEAFNRLIQLYPDDLNGNRSLGYVLSAVEQWDKALELYNQNISNRIENFLPYGSAAAAYRAKGMYEEAKDILELYKNNFSDIAGVHWDLSHTHLCQGQYETAFDEVDKAYLLNPESYIIPVYKGSIYYLSGALSEAENEYLRLLDFKEYIAQINGRVRLFSLYMLLGMFLDAASQLESGFELAERLNEKGWKSSFCQYLGHLYLKSANFEKALIECENAMNSSSEVGSVTGEIRALHLKGLINLKKNSPKEALGVADELKAKIDNWINEKLARYYYHLMGMISLEQENFSDAIEYFLKGISLLSYQYSYYDTHAVYLDPLGLAYYKMRDLENAKEQYKKITKLTTGRIDYGDIYAKAFYMLGKIYEQQGNTTKAIEHHEKFLDLWKDADPGIAEVEDARERLAWLKSQ